MTHAHEVPRAPLQEIVDAHHTEALAEHRGWLVANCAAPRDSQSWDEANRALQTFDAVYPDIRGSR